RRRREQTTKEVLPVLPGGGRPQRGRGCDDVRGGRAGRGRGAGRDAPAGREGAAAPTPGRRPRRGQEGLRRGTSRRSPSSSPSTTRPSSASPRASTSSCSRGRYGRSWPGWRPPWTGGEYARRGPSRPAADEGEQG